MIALSNFIRSLSLLTIIVFSCAVEALPSGFQEETLLSGIDGPVFLEQLPDGRMLLLQKAGTILIFDPNQQPTTTTQYLQLTNIEVRGERGLTAMALDPNFGQNGFIYVYYTHKSSSRNRISRFSHSNTIADPASELLIWEDNEDWSACCHYGGGFGFGPDGKLYLTTGEEFDGAQAQDLGRAGGKIIRINSDGSIPTDNPFVDGPGGNLDEIWAYGLRNPFRAHWDLVGERFYIAEVGGNVQETAREDLHVGRAGANYGWPDCEGQCANPDFDDPIWDYGHTGSTPNGGSISAGFIYYGNQFPEQFNGTFFVADYVQSWIRYLEFNPDGSVKTVGDFADNVGAPVHLIEGLDGALYYVDYIGTVRRIIYSDSNQAPIISSVTATPQSGAPPLVVDFSTDVIDPEGDTLSYHWLFGDGTTGTGPTPSHTYTVNGPYQVYVRVSDGNRATLSEPLQVSVGNPPTVSIDQPVADSLFRAGDVIAFSGTAVDSDETIAPSNYLWDVRFFHGTDAQPVITGQVGIGGNLTVETTGFDYDGDTRYQFTLTVTDSDGLQRIDTLNIYPDKVGLDVATVPAGIPVVIDGVITPAPFSRDSLIGFEHSVAAPITYCIGDEQYLFDTWSDGGAASHIVTVPETDFALTASYVHTGACDSFPAVGLVIHLEADTGVTTTGAAVSGWTDQSGMSNDLTGVGDPQLLPGALNGRAVIDFDGAGDKLERTAALNGLPAGSADRTIYLVANYRGTGYGGFAYGKNKCNNVFGAIVDAQGNLMVQGWCNANDFDSGEPGTGSNWLVQSVVLESDQLSHYRSGILIDSRSHTFNTVLSNLVLGAEIDGAPYMDMQVAAVLVYDRALSEAEQAQVSAYLQGKYFTPGGGGNQAPIANDDTGSVIQDGMVTLDILGNDVDPDGSLNPASVFITQNPAAGVLSLDPDTGAVQYTHDGTGGTTDSFSYQVNDNEGLSSNEATVSISVLNGDSVSLSDVQAIFTARCTECHDGNKAPDLRDGFTYASTVDVASGHLPEMKFIAPGSPGDSYLWHKVNGSQESVGGFGQQMPASGGNLSSSELNVIEAWILAGAPSEGEGGPLPASGLVVHLESDVGITVSGNMVTGWTDQSGQGNDLVAAGDPTLVIGAPSNTMVVDFDGTGDKLERTAALNGLPAGSADRTVYLVANYRGVGYGGFAYGKDSCNQVFGATVDPQGRLSIQGWCNTNDFNSGETGTGSGWLVQSVVLESDQLSHYRDGTLIQGLSHAYNTVLNKMVLGAEIDGTPSVDMQVAAVLVYDRALSVSEQSQVQAYLQDKYFTTSGTNPLPVAADDMATVATSGLVALNVLANDSDDGTLDSASVEIVQAPSAGIAVVDTGTGVIAYTHGGGVETSDTLTYRVMDDLGAWSNAATVSLTIKSYGGGSGSGGSGGSSGGGGGGGSSPIPAGGLVLHLESDIGVAVSGNTVTAWADQSGRGNDLTGSGDPLLVAAAPSGAMVVDFDGAGDKLERTATLNGLPAGSADRTVYLVANYRGTGYGGFAYGKNGCNRVFGTIVNAQGNLVVQGWCNGNDFDSGEPGTGSGWLVQSVALEADQLSHYQGDTLIDSRSHTYNTVLANMVLGAEIDSAPYMNMQVAAVLVYDRALTESERAQVVAYLQAKYITSGGGGSQAPVANDDVGSVSSGGTVTLDILANDVDPDGSIDPTTVLITQDPQVGALSLNPTTGAVQYTHDGSEGASDSFSYQVSDNEGLRSNEATVSITIGGGNPYPEGEALYQSVCFACHGTDAGGLFVRYPIRGASADTISTMINALPAMNFLSYLTTDEISDVADYLGYVTGDDSERLTGSGDAATGEALFRESCTGCHAMGTSPRFGPDLLGAITNCRSGGIGSFPGGSGNAPGWGSCEWVEAFITEPVAMATHGYTESELAAFPFVMVDLNLSGDDALDIATFIGEQASPLIAATPVTLTAEEFENTTQTYFNHCAGCHGLYRTGATGPVIDEVRSQEIGTDGLAAMMRYGTPGGMPNFGQAGILSDPEIARLAAYLQLPPPEAPPLEMPEIQGSWEVIVPVASRPVAPQHALDWEDFFGVVLRDAGKIAIFDGGSHEEISRVDVGFAVHILRSSATGRYFYAIGRDGWVSLIDLWASTPNVVARVKGCHDARSISSSKFPGYEDKHLIEGCYWPPQYVTYDGLTLEPQNLVKLPMTSINGETLQEVRVSAIVASPFAPVWVMNQKETGYVGIVDYSQEDAPLVSNIATELFLHDGGWDQTKRYYITAANGSNKMVVVDVQDESFVTSFEVGNVPHPGRGANWLDPDFGWVNATPHIGSAFVSVFGADPLNHPEHAWKVVREIAIPASGSLFIKTHPNSPWVLVDMTLSSTNDKQICAIAKATGLLDRCFDVATAGKAVHMEFNRDGSEVWIADWAGEGGGQIILDGTTLEVIQRIILPATTGKFNVYNTANDIY